MVAVPVAWLSQQRNRWSAHCGAMVKVDQSSQLLRPENSSASLENVVNRTKCAAETTPSVRPVRAAPTIVIEPHVLENSVENRGCGLGPARR